MCTFTSSSNWQISCYKTEYWTNDFFCQYETLGGKWEKWKLTKPKQRILKNCRRRNFVMLRSIFGLVQRWKRLLQKFIEKAKVLHKYSNQNFKNIESLRKHIFIRKKTFSNQEVFRRHNHYNYAKNFYSLSLSWSSRRNCFLFYWKSNKIEAKV